MIFPGKQLLGDVLGGRSITKERLRVPGWLVRARRMAGAKWRWPLWERLTRPAWHRGFAPGVSPRRDERNFPPDEGGGTRPGSGKTAPLLPGPGHHLAAAKSLPPGDATYLLPKD